MNSHQNTSDCQRILLPHPTLFILSTIVVLLIMMIFETRPARAEVICRGNTCSCAATRTSTPQSLELTNAPWMSKDTAPDLIITGLCRVPLSRTYYFKAVNIGGAGQLQFYEADSQTDGSVTHFWASSIIIEDNGTLAAWGRNEDINNSDPSKRSWQPFGYQGGVLTIHLYGRNGAKWEEDKFVEQNQGALCKIFNPALGFGPCGIPLTTWQNNGKDVLRLPGAVDDYFYTYGPLYGDGKCTKGTYNPAQGACSEGGEVGYFGNKVLGVSYGANLYLMGYKGASYHTATLTEPTVSGESWRRLEDGKSLEPDQTQLLLDTNVSTWRPNDEIVVTTTDYLPGHSEKLTITQTDGNKVSFREKIQWRHNGLRYGGPKDAPDKQWTKRLLSLQGSMDPTLLNEGAETRAAVALLTRSIRIVSGGDNVGEDFPSENTGYYYGAHMVIRQGFRQVLIQGVEFAQMGQGGRLGHYPIHFHMARKTPVSTSVVDSSINESMTRWIVLHSTNRVLVARNVGYKSIGHGFYLEDGTETDNKFYSNIGIFAGAAIQNSQNKRNIPGILADNEDPATFKEPDVPTPGFPFRSDIEYPTVFWITNGWNDFQGNMAAGAGACGAAYWLVPVVNGDMVEVSANHEHMKWDGYAGLQLPGNVNGKLTRGMDGTTPLKTFYKNYASSTMHSFQTTGDAPPCAGVLAFKATADKNPTVKAIKSDAQKPGRVPNDPPKRGTKPDTLNDHYYPHSDKGSRYATKCPGDENRGYDCSNQKQRCDSNNLQSCAVTVLDHYTSSFHWAEGAISAIWLRPQWYLLTNSVISDVQNGGLTFISGGDYTHSSIIPGYWALARNTVFVGNTNPNPDRNRPETKIYRFTSNTGPFNDVSDWPLKANETPLKALNCDQKIDIPAYCLNADEGISMPMGGFFANQRLSNIYDGPSYQDSNAYLDITVTDCPVPRDPITMKTFPCMYGAQNNVLRLRKNPIDPNDTNDPRNKNSDAAWQECFNTGKAYLPNAAIGWKQPNGFYYPPAFHSKDLFFDNVDLRHYVIDPLFKDGTYITDFDAFKRQYCSLTDKMFDSWTSIDRQTELTDDDGTLTGLSSSNAAKETVSVNDDPFFNASVETAECASAIGANGRPVNACTPDPKQPPQTAKTSPHEYVSTVVFHKADSGVWDSDCSNPKCYGVPLFRQYLTGPETSRWQRDCSTSADKALDKCRWPFIRMAGADIAQRQTMTMNLGRYYLDTTVSENKQKTEPFTSGAPSEPNCQAKPPPGVPSCQRAFNLFKADEVYYLFLVYARQTTSQTYDIYVGQNFNKDDAAQFSPIRMKIDDSNFKASPYMLGLSGTPKITPVHNPTTGILTVTINFFGVTEVEPTPDQLCQPRSFCEPSTDKKQCVSAVRDADALVAYFGSEHLKRDITATCKTWAVKDVDCPRNGCFGFSFKLPHAFVATGDYKRPDPIQFQELPTRFTTIFPPTGPGGPFPDRASTGQCYYNPANAPVSKPCAPGN
jgi:cell migration-inducing and hyaluronan-binding protein